MSTLTSAQLCVKRSSTRLHAPPGGHSTLSFGPGGFGTADAPADKADAASDRPSSRGDYAYGFTSTTNYYAPPPSSSWGSVSSSSCGSAPVSSWGSAGREQLASSASSRWGAQPPLTASKRDQNWEKKRRLWLARKNTGGPHDAPPPYQGEAPGGWPPAGGDGPMGSAAPPASPLSKFMHQHADRLPTAVPSVDSTSPAGYYFDADRPRPPSHQSRAEGHYLPPMSAGGYGRIAPPPCSPYLNYDPPTTLYPLPTSSSGSRGPPTTAPSTANTTRAGSRQPPGGHSNWSPFN